MKVFWKDNDPAETPPIDPSKIPTWKPEEKSPKKETDQKVSNTSLERMTGPIGQPEQKKVPKNSANRK